MLAVGFSVAALLDSAEEPSATVGEPAPGFTVEFFGGGELTLSDHVRDDGRTLIINLWASWCLPCRTETPEISRFAAAHPEVKVIGVAVQDTEAQARRFAEEFDPFHDLAFGNPEFEAAYPTFGLPATFVVTGEGIVDEIRYGIVNSEDLAEMAAD